MGVAQRSPSIDPYGQGLMQQKPGLNTAGKFFDGYDEFFYRKCINLGNVQCGVKHSTFETLEF